MHTLSFADIQIARADRLGLPVKRFRAHANAVQRAHAMLATDHPGALEVVDGVVEENRVLTSALRGVLVGDCEQATDRGVELRDVEDDRDLREVGWALHGLDLALDDLDTAGTLRLFATPRLSTHAHPGQVTRPAEQLRDLDGSSGVTVRGADEERVREGFPGLTVAVDAYLRRRAERGARASRPAEEGPPHITDVLRSLPDGFAHRDGPVSDAIAERVVRWMLSTWEESDGGRDLLDRLGASTFTYLDGGRDAAVFAIGDGRVAKFGYGLPGPEDDVPPFATPVLSHHDVPIGDRLGVQVTTRIEPHGTTPGHLRRLSEQAPTHGYYLQDAHLGNVGFTPSGDVVWLDGNGWGRDETPVGPETQDARELRDHFALEMPGEEDARRRYLKAVYLEEDLRQAHGDTFRELFRTLARVDSDRALRVVEQREHVALDALLVEDLQILLENDTGRIRQCARALEAGLAPSPTETAPARTA